MRRGAEEVAADVRKELKACFCANWYIISIFAFSPHLNIPIPLGSVSTSGVSMYEMVWYSSFNPENYTAPNTAIINPPIVVIIMAPPPSYHLRNSYHHELSLSFQYIRFVLDSHCPFCIAGVRACALSQRCFLFLHHHHHCTILYDSCWWWYINSTNTNIFRMYGSICCEMYIFIFATLTVNLNFSSLLY